VIAVADLVLIPARPSPHDLRAVAATVDLARCAGKPFLLIINGAAVRANIATEAVANAATTFCSPTRHSPLLNPLRGAILAGNLANVG
jgi:hypothetical protein